jgi:acetyltransferase-like isoleucine patch superfamily enzyme
MNAAENFRRPRSVLKRTFDFVAFVVVLPFVGLYALLRALRPSDTLFQAFSQFFSHGPGLPGDYLRRAFYQSTIESCAEECSIQFGTIFSTRAVRIGHGVYIGANCNIGHCTIGDDTLLGSNVMILSGKRQHNYSRLDVPIRFQGGVFRSVTVGRDVWIGNGAIVADDVGDQAIVAAGAVVVKPVAARTIVGGNPATVIGYREDPSTSAALDLEKALSQ